MQADLAMRSEEWDLIRYKFRSEPCVDYDAARPWLKVIALSSFGITECATRYHWWNTHVVYPLQSGGGRAASIIDAIDEVPDYARASSSGQQSQPRKRQQQSNSAPRKKAKGGVICYPWNDRDSGCQSPCPFGRDHVCSKCHGAHRRISCPLEQNSQGGKSGGKNNGGKGGKNKGKSGGGKNRGKGH